jgi:protein tyrosine phosphatase (PTP) superfamily phosphohydrolase (DUF442 family)
MNNMKILVVFLMFCAGFVKAESLESVVNFHGIDDGLLTSGQVLPEHVASLTENNIDLVVNLAPASEERNGQEGYLIAEQGISYVQIPVAWDQPTDQDLELFFAIMDARQNRKTLVHCFANYRGSAFTYLYRVLRLDVNEAEARKDLEAVWNEEAFTEHPQWRVFIDRQLAKK